MNSKKQNKSGQSLIEYIAITALVAIVSIGAVKMFGNNVQKRLKQISTKFDSTVGLSFRTSAKSAGNSDGDDGDDGGLGIFRR